MPENGFQGAGQFRAGAFEFRTMRQGETAQNAQPRRSEANPDFALVFQAGSACDGSGGFEAVYELDGAVVLDEKTRGDFADGRLDLGGEAMDGEQQLVLLGLDPVLFRGGFAEVEKLADLAAEFGEIAVLVGGKIGLGHDNYIVTRYNWRKNGMAG